MSGLFKILLLGFLFIAYNSLASGETSELHLECSYLDPVNCKLEFRAQFENALRIHMMELITKITTQSSSYIRDALKKIPKSETSRRDKLQELIDLYDQSMEDAIENKNDTRQLFIIISGGAKFRTYSLPKLLGEENAFQLDYKNLNEVDRFSTQVGNVWMELYNGLGEDDKKQFTAYSQITEEVKVMLEGEGLIKLELFKRLLRKIFIFLNMTNGN